MRHSRILLRKKGIFLHFSLIQVLDLQATKSAARQSLHCKAAAICLNRSAVRATAAAHSYVCC